MSGDGSNDRLKQYHDKRDFRRTDEPQGDSESTGGSPIFVVQKHDATSLHYDLRLEVDGILKSWAVPKGPSTDPRERRLALPTEDHPLEYAQFEGVIPADEYGGGTVMVWDRGTYRNLKERDGDEVPVGESFEDGQVEVWLEGEKLRGGYAVIRTQGGDEPRWLLIKMKDECADARRNPTSTENESVLTGRTMEEIRDQA